MDDIRWTEALSVGNETIDDDHRHLFRLLDQLQHATLGEALGVVDELVAYTEVHFQREEAFMLKMGYPAYLEHKAEHEHFFGEVHAFRSSLTQGTQSLIPKTSALLGSWLNQHVLVFDKALADYLNEHSVEDWGSAFL